MQWPQKAGWVSRWLGAKDGAHADSVQWLLWATYLPLVLCLPCSDHLCSWRNVVTHAPSHASRLFALSWAGMKGSWLWTWKDSIDRTFMARFGADLDFEAMQRKGPPASSSAAGALQQTLPAEELALMAAAKMRCGGCGSKVGATSLDRVLQRLRAEGSAGLLQNGSGNGKQEQLQQQAGTVVLGLEQPDDAAVLEPPPPGHVTVGAGCWAIC